MKQILQSLKTGETTVADVPAPSLRSGYVVVNTSHTLVSAGTERMLVDFGKASWVDKARQQPDKVRMVLDKVRTDGLATTIDAVQSKLDQPLALGYCNVGKVAEVGAGVDGIALGDRIVSNGGHAQVVCVPKNLSAKIPDSVTDEQASFTVLAAIGLQGIRLANPTLGECVVVTGLGLIGLLTVQMLRAQGCRVLGIDLEPARLEMAKRFGAEVVNPGAGEDVLSAAASFSRGRGVDAVIITASTRSNEPVSQAANMCRKRGRIVLVGVTGLELSRADFYEKELSFQVSCSYGPGRYDPAYEESGQDYPIGYVRWTEQRNFEAVLDLMASGALDVDPLISHRFTLEQAEEAYDLLSSGKPSMGILLEYPYQDGVGPKVVPLGEVEDSTVQDSGSSSSTTTGKAVVGFLGAGNYAGRVLIPAFKDAGAELHTVVSGGGVSSVHYGKKHGFAQASTDGEALMEDASVNTLVIATRHNSHARQVLEGLRSGKHIFCEKPLCLNQDELAEIEAEASKRPDQLLMIGFNRRFAPHVVAAKSLLDKVAEPKNLVMTVNAGAIPADHWTQDWEVGGGRIIGEACHFIDLLRHLVGAPITGYFSVAVGRHPSVDVADDRSTITLTFDDGSVGTIHYLSNGDKGFPKERLEVFCAGRVLQLDNFRKLRAFGWPGVKGNRLWRQDKGQGPCAAAFVEAVGNGGTSPISRAEIFEVSRVTIEVAENLRNQN
ncbi:bi-domain-containing oxidoreductase [Marinobacter sp. CHS3-4]|uniref:bi-domain-containing oxidoreductase n=1 Tax=Marinobacter sp. CHS3-4 TaxID=3045174 RepID=UPI0024B4FC4B|nr:bi-domain-containing oxidoreductase [Marinobacter sp. CHS3-4]MDI9244999.1 bi-domain-containing oxidoreductase [Marinobacter sp. CHS3-4]